MDLESVSVTQILEERTSSDDFGESFAVCCLKSEVSGIEINGILHENVSNSILFLDPNHKWTIFKKDSSRLSGYILHLTNEVLNNPILSNLHINKVRLFNSGEIPLFQLSPGIEKRTQAILEMVDELLASNLNHREDAILSLLNTFFVYCDGQCNIKSVASTNNSKIHIVYRFKMLVDKLIYEHHDVAEYANLLNISSTYLNECVNEVLSVSSKSIITEQLLMRSRHSLKFSDKSIKEISFELGFSSPDYFSYFLKKHTGYSPTLIRKS